MSHKRIRQAVRANRYEFSMHALEEMDDDDLTEADVRRVLLDGNLKAELTDDPRGPRLTMRGRAAGIEIEVVCRFLRPSGELRIITVYAVED